MDVLIKNFDMPENCEECPLANDECFGAWKCSYVKQWGGKKRAEDCPLLILPSHGDLIDIEDLKSLLLSMWSKGEKYNISDVFREIPDIPVVIKSNS